MFVEQTDDEVTANDKMIMIMIIECSSAQSYNEGRLCITIVNR